MTEPIKRRKPDASRKSKGLNLRVTQAELETLHKKAKKAGMTMRDYVVSKALGRRIK